MTTTTESICVQSTSDEAHECSDCEFQTVKAYPRIAMPLTTGINLHSRRSGGQLYRVMCDLLASLGILALLFILVLLTQVNGAAAEAKQMKDERDAASAIAADAKLAAAQASERADAVEKKLKQGTPIRLIVLLDLSASMAEGLSRLREAIAQLAELAPRVTRFEIGVVAFRETPVAVLPLTTIGTDSNDVGLSKVRSFLSGLETVTGYSGIDLAAVEALTMLAAAPYAGEREVLAVLADVGPGEKQSHTANSAADLVSELALWASDPARDRRIVSLYTGAQDSEHRSFFQQLGQLPEAVYSEQSSGILPAVFQASFAPPK